VVEAEAGWEARIREHLRANFALHESTIYYWCQWELEGPEEIFLATPMMREIWNEKSEDWGE